MGIERSKMDEVEQQALIEIDIQKFPSVKKRVPIMDCYPNWWNTNFQNEGILKKVKANIEKLGAVDPIHVRTGKGENKYEIVDGEHRWKTMVGLGYKEIDIEDLGNISDETAMRLTINLNNLRGSDDPMKRSKLMKHLRDKDEANLVLLPFERKQIDAEIGLGEFDMSDFEKRAKILPEVEAKPLEAVLEQAIKLNSRISHVIHYVKDKDAYELLTKYFDWFKIFESMMKAKKDIVEGQVPMFKDKEEGGDKVV